MAKKGKKFNKYTPEFKKEAVEKYLSGELGGMTSATYKLGLKSGRQLRDWVKLCRQDPELLKQINRGKASLKDGVRKGRPKQVKLDEMSKDGQIEYLKMENAILKKVYRKSHYFPEVSAYTVRLYDEDFRVDNRQKSLRLISHRLSSRSDYG